MHGDNKEFKRRVNLVNELHER